MTSLLHAAGGRHATGPEPRVTGFAVPRGEEAEVWGWLAALPSRMQHSYDRGNDARSAKCPAHPK